MTGPGRWARELLARPLVQPDARSCGAASLVVARALVDEPPHLRRDGGFVREGARAELDEARALRDDSRKVMAALEARYVEATGVRALKVRHNNILGYYIEVPAGSAKPLQSRQNARFTDRIWTGE